ncbi:hypothetical protein EI94DRAFT_1833425 [Lactarius quietus]|nr:hypothetical protein EI94DRAFT_1833425 [Lactarius quietus]
MSLPYPSPPHPSRSPPSQDAWLWNLDTPLNSFLAEALVKFWHVVDGIFIWEFCITLDYEWSVIRGHRPYRWTIWIHSLTRVCTLITLILNMVAFDSSGPINCQAWIICELVFGTLAFAAAAALIVLRIIAIWDRNRIAVAIAMCAWSTNVAFLLHFATGIIATWVPEQSTCAVLNAEGGKKNVIATLVTDVVLLLTMLVGLLRLRVYGTMFGLGKLLWRQGLIWLFLATTAEVPPAVFIGLNLNGKTHVISILSTENNELDLVGKSGPFDLMFQTPALVVMSIVATRMYRSLTDFTDSGRNAYDTHPTRRARTANTDPTDIFSPPIPLDQMEVAIHTSSEGYQHAKAGQYASYGPYGPYSQSQDKSFLLNTSCDPENDVKRG